MVIGTTMTMIRTLSFLARGVIVDHYQRIVMMFLNRNVKMDVTRNSPTAVDVVVRLHYHLHVSLMLNDVMMLVDQEKKTDLVPLDVGYDFVDVVRC